MKSFTKQYLMIHEMNENSDVGNHNCTFDDGLLSQYTYGRNIDNEKIYFICPSFIENGVNDIGQKCMNIEHIKKLMDLGIEIGAHSYYHAKLWKLPDLKHRIYHIKKDTDLMLKWFDVNLGLKPEKFCFPYNFDLDGLYKAALVPYGFKEYFGNERIDIDKNYATNLGNNP